MPAAFVETTDGTVLIFNGIDTPLAYRPDLDRAEPAGVEVGGDQSPILTPLDPPTAAGGTLRGGGKIAGRYRAFVRFLNARGEPGNPSPISDEVNAAPVTLSNQSVGYARMRYTRVPVPTSTAVVRKQILRNTAGQYGTFYVDVDTTDLQGTQFDSYNGDDVLADQTPVVMLDNDNRPLFNRFAPPPSMPTAAVLHLGRVWAAGVQEYSEGSVALVRGSAAVVGTGCRWPASFKGRFFHHPSGFVSEIAGVTPTADRTGQPAMTLTDPFPYQSDPFSSYAVRPERTADEAVVYSEPGLYEAFPGDNQFVTRRDGDPVTALVPLRSFLYVARRRSMDRITAQGDPRTDGYVFDSIARGCVGPRSFVVAEGVAYVMDERGVYSFDGSAAQPLSVPVQDLFRRDNRAGRRVNWTRSRYFHTTYSSDTQTVRFFITLGTGHLPRHALCLGLDGGKWWLEEYPVPIGASCVGVLGRRTGTYADPARKTLLGGPAGRVFVTRRGADVGTGETVRTVAAGLDWISFRRSALVQPGTPVAVERGRGRDQTRVVCQVAADGRLLLDRPWAVLPARGDTLVVGGIPWAYQTHRLEYTASEDQDGFSVTVEGEPGRNRVRVDLIRDFAVAPALNADDLSPLEGDGLSGDAGEPGVTIDLAAAQGTAVVRADRHREVFTPGERGLSVRLSGASGADPVRLYDLALNGVVRQ